MCIFHASHCCLALYNILIIVTMQVLSRKDKLNNLGWRYGSIIDIRLSCVRLHVFLLLHYLRLGYVTWILRLYQLKPTQNLSDLRYDSWFYSGWLSYWFLFSILFWCNFWPKFWLQFWLLLRLKLRVKRGVTRADTALTKGPPNPKYWLLLIQTVAMSWQHVCSCFLSLLLVLLQF